MNKVLMLELNELTPRLVQRFMDEGHLPNFKRLYESAWVMETDAMASGLNLNPWIQWVTVHTGQTFEEHGVYLLGEGHHADVTTISDVASRANRNVFMCGSMNVGWKPDFTGTVIPDAWAERVEAQPRSLEPFRNFVQKNVQEHTNPSFQSGFRDYLSFGNFMLKHGLSVGTGARIAKQLLMERFRPVKWKRSLLLDYLQWDLFSWKYAKDRPDFATFFSNSVAHTQHTHWREFEPGEFDIRASARDEENFRGAMLDSYKANDSLIGKAMSLIDDETVLIFCTALSQKPATAWESTGGKTFHRPYDLDAFCKSIGIEGEFKCKPVMAEEFWIAFTSEVEAIRACEVLEGLRYGREKFMKFSRRGADVYTGCRIYQAMNSDAVLEANGRSLGKVSDLIYKSEDTKSGVHDPRGLLWIRMPDRDQRVFRSESVPLTRIAPTILDLLAVKKPATMRDDSLLNGLHKSAA